MSSIHLYWISAYNYRMLPSEFIIIIVLVAIILYWINTVVVKEIASKHGENECKRLGVTFLDATVAITKTRLKRDGNGIVRFSREYIFEFSSDGVRRYPGSISMLGKVLTNLQMSAYPDPTSTQDPRYNSIDTNKHSNDTKGVVVSINQDKKK